MSPIEVFYAAPPPASERSTADEDALVARLRDELSLESAHGKQDPVGGWEKRLKGLQGVVAGPAKAGAGLGAPPQATEVGELRAEGRDSDDSSESEKTSESSAEEDCDAD